MEQPQQYPWTTASSRRQWWGGHESGWPQLGRGPRKRRATETSLNRTGISALDHMQVTGEAKVLLAAVLCPYETWTAMSMSLLVRDMTSRDQGSKIVRFTTNFFPIQTPDRIDWARKPQSSLLVINLERRIKLRLPEFSAQALLPLLQMLTPLGGAITIVWCSEHWTISCGP